MKADWLIASWYKPSWISRCLLPLSGLYRLIIWLRRLAYERGIFKTYALPVPVIVVGNISVGGSGKTPFVIWLAQYLQQQGWRPGIISRGYGSQADQYPCSVYPDSVAAKVGDEPLMIVRRTGCPLVIAPDRVAAGRHLLAAHPCDVIITDDGLQHYRLQRDVEIAIVDVQRGLGNQACLPAGPLREPVSRLSSVDLVIANGAPLSQPFSMQLQIDQAVQLIDGSCHKPLQQFSDTSVHCVAGIGHPQRFFEQLQQLGLTVIPHAFSDHHIYEEADLRFDDRYPILMTEKDAVKCQHFATSDMWFVPAEALISPATGAKILDKLRER